jgi:ribosomal protein L40E
MPGKREVSPRRLAMNPTSTITCPKCGMVNPANAMNCKRCRINLIFALDHPEALQGRTSKETGHPPAEGQAVEQLSTRLSLLVVGAFLVPPLVMILAVFVVPSVQGITK